MERREQKRPFIKLNNSTHIIFTWCCVYCVAMPCRPTYNDNGKKPQKVARAKVRFSGALTKYMSVEVYAIGMYLCIFNWPLNTKWQTHASNLSEKRSIVWYGLLKLMPKNHLKYLCHKLIRSQSIRRVGNTLSYSVSCMLYEIIYSIWSLHSAMIPSISRICDCCLSHCVCVTRTCDLTLINEIDCTQRCQVPIVCLNVSYDYFWLIE